MPNYSSPCTRPCQRSIFDRSATWFRCWAVLAFVLQLLDWHSTWLYYHIKTESNPILLWLAECMGMGVALVMAKSVAVAFIVLYVRLVRVDDGLSKLAWLHVWVMGIVAFAYSVVVTRNYIS